MLISFTGTDAAFFQNGFFDSNGTTDSFEDVSVRSTALVGFNTETGYTATLLGRFSLTPAGNEVTGGTVTGLTFVQNSVLQGQISDISWDVGAFVEAILDIEFFLDFTALAILVEQGTDTLTIDATAAQAGFDSSGFMADFLQTLLIPVVFNGSAFDDEIIGGPGNDTISGGAGSDTLVMDTFRDDFLLSITETAQGFTTEFHDSGIDQVSGIEFVAFQDQTVALADLFTGILHVGDDTAEFVNGTNRNDTITGARGNDEVLGENGRDDILGGAGDDTLEGGTGNDTLKGGRGQDILRGDDGDDIMRGQREADRIGGGSGNDNIKGGGGNDTLYGDAGNDFLKGGTRRDEIFGGDGNDILIGNSFDDLLDGGAGRDRLLSGGDNDTLIGGEGNDFLKSGSGMDVFVFDLDDGRDQVNDLDLANDMLEISAALADGRDAQGIEDLAQVVGDNVEIDFGGGDVIILQGFDTTEGLAEVIAIV